MDFFIETPSNIILMEGKYGGNEVNVETAWEKQAGGSEGYVFPSFYSKSEKTRVRLVLNFDNEGIYQWKGAKYDAEGKLVENLVQHLKKKQKFMNLRKPPSKKFISGLCKQPISTRDNLKRHIKTVHNITDSKEIEKFIIY